ncbi:hypothetical protein OHC33_008808 [Knufia fluminis]|uniref:F-box domain-containing protein n=1 Tax=Knufia fluminis TaxID=191047 RepID=A0AAN8EF61_9EURO|nr:hypothetical protein OHC33_008808 [Knufia fluminis]
MSCSDFFHQNHINDGPPQPNQFQLAQDAQSHSPLLQLPQEILTMILRLLLVNSVPLTHLTGSASGIHRRESSPHPHAQIACPNYSFAPALLQTCQELQHQGAKLIYGENTLRITFVLGRGGWYSSATRSLNTCYILDATITYMESQDRFFDFRPEAYDDWPMTFRSPQESEKVDSIRNALHRFGKCHITVAESSRRHWIHTNWSVAPRRTWLEYHCQALANVARLLHTVVHNKHVVLVLTFPQPEWTRKPGSPTRGIAGNNYVRNPTQWTLQEVVCLRWWKCRSIDIQTPYMPESVKVYLEKAITAPLSGRKPESDLESYRDPKEDLLGRYFLIHQRINHICDRIKLSSRRNPNSPFADRSRLHHPRDSFRHSQERLMRDAMTDQQNSFNAQETILKESIRDNLAKCTSEQKEQYGTVAATIERHLELLGTDVGWT